MTTTKYVKSGPLVANAAWTDDTGFWHLNGIGSVPEGTKLQMTGNRRAGFAEGASPYQLQKGQTAWYSEKYLTDTAPGSVEKLGQVVEGTGVADVAVRDGGFEAWANSVFGIRLNVDGRADAQCVDVAKSWSLWRAGISPFESFGNGQDFATNISKMPGWSFRGPEFFEQAEPGWIASWKWKTYGHVAVVESYRNGKLNVINQNGYSDQRPVHRASFEKSGLVGFAVPPALASGKTHKVQLGETFSKIAQKYDIPLSDVLKLNPGVVPERLQVGAVVKVG